MTAPTSSPPPPPPAWRWTPPGRFRARLDALGRAVDRVRDEWAAEDEEAGRERGAVLR